VNARRPPALHNTYSFGQRSVGVLDDVDGESADDKIERVRRNGEARHIQHVASAPG
jgi:hypothetical protein